MYDFFQIYQVLKSLPILKVGVGNINGKNYDDFSNKTNNLAKSYNLHIGEEYSLSILLERLNKPVEKRAYAPKFHKPKTEGWILTLGDIESNELLALRRVTFTHRTTVQLMFYPPERKGKEFLRRRIFGNSQRKSSFICYNVQQFNSRETPDERH